MHSLGPTAQTVGPLSFAGPVGPGSNMAGWWVPGPVASMREPAQGWLQQLARSPAPGMGSSRWCWLHMWVFRKESIAILQYGTSQDMWTIMLKPPAACSEGWYFQMGGGTLGAVLD